MQLISYAQNFEDVRLWRAFRDIDQGRYLDIGTQDPSHDSVSRFFYDRGWRGVHVEPTPHYASAMRDARPDEKVIEAAVSCSHEPIAFFEIPNTGLSTGVPEIAKFHEKAGWAHREILVPTISLAGLLEYMGPDPIHWLKIDVEGMEVDVLRSWGDHPGRPAALVIEATKPSTQEPTHETWQDLVTGRGYREVLFDGLSRYFIHDTEAHRAEDLALSPNVFDGFQVLRTHFSAQHVAAENERTMDDLRSEAKAQAQTHSEQLAETAAAAADASTQLDAAIQRVSDLEGKLSSEVVAHEKALALARAAAVDASSKLDIANAQVTLLEEQWQEQSRLHAAALALVKEQTSEAQREAAENKGQLAAIQAEHLSLGRLTGRLEGQLAAREQWDAAKVSAAAAQRDELRYSLQRAERELASLRGLEVDLRSQLAVRIARTEAVAAAAAAEKEAANGSLAAVREQARQFAQQAAELKANLAVVSQQRDEFAAQVHGLSRDRSGLAEELEVAKREAAEIALALRNEIEGLSAAIALRERKVAEAEGLLTGMPDPLGGTSGLRQALARRLIGAGQLSVIADYQAAALEWKHGKPQLAFLDDSGGDASSLDSSPQSLGGRPATVGVSMFVDEGPITSVGQLLAPNDRLFIQAAYRSVLGREPELEGEAYYLGRLRTGVHKLAILKQLRLSSEGRAFVPAVVGLDRAIKRYRWAMLPLLGICLRRLWGIDGNGVTHRGLRVIANDVGRIRSELGGQQAEKGSQAQLAAMADAVRDLAARPFARPGAEILQGLADLTPRVEKCCGSEMAAGGMARSDPSLGRNGSRILRHMALSMQTQNANGVG